MYKERFQTLATIFVPWAAALSVLMHVNDPVFAQQPVTVVGAPVVTTANQVIDDQAATWSSLTTVQASVTAADGAAGTLNLNTVAAGCATIWSRPLGTAITAGQLAFDVSFNGGTSWVRLSGSNGDETYVQSDLAPHTTAANGQEAGWRFPVHAFSKLRVRLQVGIVGADSVTVSARSVSEGCAPFTIARQGDPSRLNMSARAYVTAAATASWTSDTALNTRAEVVTKNLSTVFVTVRVGGTVTGGTIVSQLSDDNGVTYFDAPGMIQYSVANASVANNSFTISVPASTRLSIKLTKVLTGTSPTLDLVLEASSAAPMRTSTVNYKTGFVLTQALLGSSGVYTSQWFNNQSDGSQAIVCLSRSDAASAASGFQLQQTNDTSDANFTTNSYSTTANAATTTSAFTNTYQRFWRVLYTNGGTAQTSFKIACSLSPVQFTLADTAGIIYTNPTVYTAYDLGVSNAATQRVALAQELTYAAGTTAKTATTAGTGPFFNVCGSATKTIRIQRLSISGTVATAAVYGDLVVKKTSAATTAGTSTALTALPYDSTSAAATGTSKFYTALGTAGASVGVLLTETLFFPVTATGTSIGPQLVYQWRDPDTEAPTLRGTAQCLEASFGTTTTNAPTLTVSVTWTEK